MTTPPYQPPPYGGTPPQQPAPGWGPPPQYPGQPGPAQPYPGQAQPGHAYPGQPAPGQAYPDQAYPGQPYPGQPYPGQPYPGQQSGPPQGQYPQQPYGPPQQGFTPPSAGRTSKGAKALLSTVGLIIVGIVVAAVISGINGPAGAEPGDCIKVNKVGVTSADIDKVDCGSMDATYKVAVNLDSSRDSCPSGDYSEYTDSGGRRSDGFKLCMVLNAREGDCFKQEGTIVAGKTTKIVCDSSATHKVRKVITGTADESACEGGDFVSVYSQPATTVCLIEV
ncbi:hypothetical protein GCM10022243_12640 [Saccharothrix violaceirubra]|uniref:Uncharacterized protein n=1 Tax=Saccharothrix violaceirubra TaxID=413306 RepID=A0A7W7WYZ4_9PSEU|nr:hypothetical protein [Saccharothrix violaceirubra]MBB4968762.1 hypothetical protein [Saccharothrix violaceirubra]